MEELGWWIYLCSITNDIKTIFAIFFIFCAVAAVITLVVWCGGNCMFTTAKKCWKLCLLVGIPCMFLFMLIPSKSTAYQILGVTVTTEVIKNSEALQELSEKSFEALNRFLDSIASEEEKDTESRSTY